MPNLPRPKVLPKVVNYDPRDAPRSTPSAGGGVGQTVDQSIPFLQATSALGRMFPATNPALLGMGGNAAASLGQPDPYANIEGQRNGLTVEYAPNIPSVSGAAAGGTVGGTAGVAGNPVADRRYDDLEEQRMREMARMNAAVTNNQNNTKVAQAAGDTANLARLTAEWERLKASPLYQQMYGGANENDLKNRLVSVYMKPGNPAAANDLAGAMSAAIADDVWANAATQAFGRPPNQLEWDEHWKAMNVGGRDPLEGHPQAIQNIKATMQGFANNNQQTSYNDYSTWAGGH